MDFFFLQQKPKAFLALGVGMGRVIVVATFEVSAAPIRRTHQESQPGL
jgi:hypothetical protein